MPDAKILLSSILFGVVAVVWGYIQKLKADKFKAEEKLRAENFIKLQERVMNESVDKLVDELNDRYDNKRPKS